MDDSPSAHVAPFTPSVAMQLTMTRGRGSRITKRQKRDKRALHSWGVLRHDVPKFKTAWRAALQACSKQIATHMKAHGWKRVRLWPSDQVVWLTTAARQKG